MQQLNHIEARKLEWREVDAPAFEDDHGIIVGPLTVATRDMDVVVIHGLKPLRGSAPIGHEGEGAITEVGDALTKRMAISPSHPSVLRLARSNPIGHHNA